MKLYYILKYNTTLDILTGIRIGDTKDGVQIGGIDNPVIRVKAGSRKNQPYIPGSSLKGKIRCLLQQVYGYAEFRALPLDRPAQVINDLFGCLDGKGSDNKKIEGNSSKIVFRDSYLTAFSENMLLNSEYTDMPYTEQKFENSISRLTGKTAGSGGARNQERVPAGAQFDIEIVIKVFANDKDEADKTKSKYQDLLFMGIKLLNFDYLGGSGSRGYGQVNIVLPDPIIESLQEVKLVDNTEPTA